MREQQWEAHPYESERDLESIRSLMKRTYGEVELSRNDFLKWQYFENPAGNAIIWLAKDRTNSDILAGVYAVVPVNVIVAGQERAGSLAINGVTHPQYQRQRIFTSLVKKGYTSCEERGIALTYGFPNPNAYPAWVDTIRVKVIGESKLMVFPLRWNDILKAKIGNPIARGFVRTLAPIARNLIFRRRVADTPHNLRIEGQDIFGDVFDAFWERVKGKYPAMVLRRSTYMNWRFTTAPTRDYLTFVAMENGYMRAFVTCRKADLFGLSCGIIADFLVESSEVGEAAGSLLLDRCLEYFSGEGVALAGCMLVAGSHEFGILKTSGFMACPRPFLPQPFPVIMKTHSTVVPPAVVEDIRNWYLTFGDYDGL